MKGEWQKTTIGSQVTLQRGIDITRREQQPGKVPVISSGGISSYHNVSAVKGPGVVIGRKGTLGTVFYVQEDYWPHDTTLWVKNFHGNVPRFVYYFFKALKLERLDVGSANPTLNRNHVHPITVLWPSLPIQRRISDILGALDDKIECNRRMNQTLEAMAQALYKHWFVDFGPFRDGEMADSEMGRIPKGWVIKSLADCCDILSGGTPSTSIANYWDGDISWVSARDVSQKEQLYVMQTERKITPLGVRNSATRILPINTVVIVARGSVGEFAMLGSDMAMNQTSYGLQGKGNISQSWVYLTVANVMDRLKKAAYGTVFDTITTTTFRQLKVVVAPDAILETFNGKAAPLFGGMHSNAKENQLLTRTRDYLLPKLLSGEIEVKDAETRVAETA